MNGSNEGENAPSQLIDAKIEELSDWRGETLAWVRMLIKEADHEVVEEWKWRGVPVWSHGGIICTGETYKSVVKLTFAKGASLEDPSGLFNSSLEGNTRRAIDIHEGDRIDEQALKALIRAAVTLNLSVRATLAALRRKQRAPEHLICSRPLELAAQRRPDPRQPQGGRSPPPAHRKAPDRSGAIGSTIAAAISRRRCSGGRSDRGSSTGPAGR
ncbi:hypothetical protein ABIA24_000384 [Sinorhizobium fredii]